jgi:hypothetical protein
MFLVETAIPHPQHLNRLIRGLIAMTTALTFLNAADEAEAQPAGVNYDESKVPAYTLPDPLAPGGGPRVQSADEWRERGRPATLDLFKRFMFGVIPEGQVITRADLISDHEVFDGKGRRREYTLTLTGPTGRSIAVDVLVYTPVDPKRADRSWPAFLGLNFKGNHAVDPDPRIKLCSSWLRPDGDNVVNNRATEKGRGSERSRWPIQTILGRGYAVVTACYHDIDPDYDDGFENGAHALFAEGRGRPRDPSAWGSIAAWAWGLSRIRDHLQTVPEIDPSRVAVMGHSRLGKTALWAGALDERFALVISNESGCGGAALSRRRFGETLERINTAAPHWFCGAFHMFNGKEDELPFDQHQLIALAAPRPVLVCSASEDLWADPKGEFLSALNADPVYRLLGVVGMEAREMPGIGEPILSRVGYHIRAGKHDTTDVDWAVFLDFADRHLTATIRPD